MATLVQFRDQIIIDAGINNNPNFPITRLNRIINLAQRYVQTQLNGLGMKKWESSISIGTLSAGTHGATATKTFVSSVLTNMLESPNSIRFIETTDGSSGKGVARPIDENVFEEQIVNTYLAPTLSKPVFCRISGNIHLMPATITGGTAHYYKAITDLSADGDTSEIPLEFEEFVIKRAVMEIQDTLGKLQDKELKSRQLEKDLGEVYSKFLGKQVEQNRSKMDNSAKLQ